MVGECEALRTMNDFDEDEQMRLVVEHITSTAIDCKPLRDLQSSRISRVLWANISRQTILVLGSMTPWGRAVGPQTQAMRG